MFVMLPIDIRIQPGTLVVGTSYDLTNGTIVGGHITLPGQIIWVTFNVSGNINITNSRTTSSPSIITNINHNNRSVDVMVRIAPSSSLSLSYASPSTETTQAFTSTSECIQIVSIMDHANNNAMVSCLVPFGSWHDMSFSLWYTVSLFCSFAVHLTSLSLLDYLY
jgi:hypothetical protein